MQLKIWYFSIISLNLNMKEKVYIKSSFKEQLQKIGCGIRDFITITRVEDKKIFFSAGKCKLCIPQDELDDIKI